MQPHIVEDEKKNYYLGYTSKFLSNLPHKNAPCIKHRALLAYVGR